MRYKYAVAQRLSCGTSNHEVDALESLLNHFADNGYRLKQVIQADDKPTFQTIIFEKEVPDAPVQGQNQTA
jgi:predicted regulator of amino acid metabolism with ACT domain